MTIYKCNKCKNVITKKDGILKIIGLINELEDDEKLILKHVCYSCLLNFLGGEDDE